MARVSKLHVNGGDLPVDVDSERSLLSVLRDDPGLTGSKYGCGEGRCGAGTVLVDGKLTVWTGNRPRGLPMNRILPAASLGQSPTSHRQFPSTHRHPAKSSSIGDQFFIPLPASHLRGSQTELPRQPTVSPSVMAVNELHCSTTNL